MQGIPGFPAPALIMPGAGKCLPGLPGLAYQGMEVKKKNLGTPPVIVSKLQTTISNNGASALSVASLPRKAGDLVIISVGIGIAGGLIGGGPGAWSSPPNGNGVGDGVTVYKFVTDTSAIQFNGTPNISPVPIVAMVIRGVTSTSVRASSAPFTSDATAALPAFPLSPNSLGVVTMIESAGTAASSYGVPTAGTPNVFKSANLVSAFSSTGSGSAPFGASAIAACLIPNFPATGAAITWHGAGQNAEWWALELLS